MVNYRDLLIKYINHVGEAYGIDNSLIFDGMSNFTEEENIMLITLELEARAIKNDNTA